METLVLFAKAPIAGATKSRIAHDHGDVAAAQLSSAMLQDTCDMLAVWQQQRVAADQNRRIVLYAAGAADDSALVAAAALAGARIEAQGEGDLGVRLDRAFAKEFERGARAVAAIGSDSPTLPAHLLDEAFRALAWERVVIGPAFDGGYWLIGAQRPAPSLFSAIPWSTDGVLPETLAALRAQRIDAHLLPFWYDVDRDRDLVRLQWHMAAIRQKRPTACAHSWRALEQLGLLTPSRPAFGAHPQDKQ